MAAVKSIPSLSFTEFAYYEKNTFQLSEVYWKKNIAKYVTSIGYYKIRTNGGCNTTIASEFNRFHWLL